MTVKVICEKIEEALNFLYLKKLKKHLQIFQEPELLKPFSNLSLTNDITNANNKNYIESLDELADIIEPWLGYGDISDKLRDIEQNFSSRISKCVENRPDGIKVLNHGDLWINNVLFKYEKDQPKDLSFVSIFIIFLIEKKNVDNKKMPPRSIYKCRTTAALVWI